MMLKQSSGGQNPTNPRSVLAPSISSKLNPIGAGNHVIMLSTFVLPNYNSYASSLSFFLLFFFSRDQIKVEFLLQKYVVERFQAVESTRAPLMLITMVWVYKNGNKLLQRKWDSELSSYTEYGANYTEVYEFTLVCDGKKFTNLLQFVMELKRQ